MKSHEYGLLGIVSHQAQLDYALREQVYHMPYRSKQLRLRADFVILIISESQTKEQHGAVYHAKVRSVNFGTRGAISPLPPGDESGKRTAEAYVWFETEAWDEGYPGASLRGSPTRCSAEAR